MKSIVAILVLLLCATAVAAEDNVMTIDDVQLCPGASAGIPVVVCNATDVAAGQVDITYDPTVIEITGVLNGDLDWTKYNLEASATSVRIVILSLGGGKTGDLTMCTLQVTAVGSIGDVSPLSMDAICLSDPNAIEIVSAVNAGSVEIISDNLDPVITDIHATDFAPGGSGRIGVTASDPDGTIAIVTFDLTPIGLGIVEYNYVSGDRYEYEFQMPANVLPGTYDIVATVTDDDGATTQITIPVAVIVMGDVNGDGTVDSLDALMVITYIVDPDNTAINPDVADVVADGVLNVRDAIHILNIATGNTGE